MLAMLRSIVRASLRSARRRPGTTALNVAGLTLGLASCLLITLYVRDEVTVDRFHERADRIVRVSQEVTVPGREALQASTGGAMGEDLAANVPAIEAVVRVLRQAGPVRSETDPDRRFREEAFVFADDAFFDLFSYRFVRGDAATALRQPNAVVLTAETAARYFGDADPVGQPMVYGDRLDLTVSGVVAAPPGPTHLPFDFVAPMAAFKGLNGMPATAKGPTGGRTCGPTCCSRMPPTSRGSRPRCRSLSPGTARTVRTTSLPSSPSPASTLARPRRPRLPRGAPRSSACSRRSRSRSCCSRASTSST